MLTIKNEGGMGPNWSVMHVTDVGGDALSVAISGTDGAYSAQVLLRAATIRDLSERLLAYVGATPPSGITGEL